MTPSYCATLANPRHLLVSPPNPVGGETAFLPIDSGAALFYWSEAVPLYSADRKRCRSIYWSDAVPLYPANRKRCRSILPIGSAAAQSTGWKQCCSTHTVDNAPDLFYRSASMRLYS